VSALAPRAKKTGLLLSIIAKASNGRTLRPFCGTQPQA